MKVTIIGTGYVGLVTGACLADVGNHVMCLDIDPAKIAMLNAGEIPIFEPGLRELVQANRAAGRLQFTTDIERATLHGHLQFIAVGTPPGEDGSADLRHVLAAADGIARHLREPKVIINKSTVPVGTAERVRQAIATRLAARGVDIDFQVVSNPEFLKEGDAIADFMRPDRIVVGAEEPSAIKAMQQLYAPFERNRAKLMVMDVRSAELTKYAANAMLATRISFMNEMALLAERVGADIDHIRRGIGADPRIGSHFLYAGCGYGGSCFPKDVKAVLQTGLEHGLQMQVIDAVERANETQKRVPLDKLSACLGPVLDGRHVAVWGLAFKPGTDDMREAPSLVLIDALLQRGASVTAYDPVAQAEAQRALGRRPGLAYAGSAMQAVEGADALVIVTEWKEFRSPDFTQLREQMRRALIVDARNILDPEQARQAGFEYHGIGRS